MIAMMMFNPFQVRRNYDAVWKCTEDVNIFEMNYLLVPVVANNHW